MSQLPSETEVLIAGAGPAGLASAISLIEQGVPSTSIVIVDALSQGLNSSRAVIVHAYTLEILDKIGVTQTMIDNAIKADTLSLRDGNKLLLQLDFTKLDTPHPHAILLPQNETERILSEKLATLGVTVIRPLKVSNVTDMEEAIKTVTFESGEVLKARYIIAADGIKSTVRKLSGIPYIDPHHPKVAEDSEDALIQLTLADITYDSSTVPKAELSIYLDRKGLVVWVPLPQGHARILGSALISEAPVHKDPDVAEIQHLLDSRRVGEPENVKVHTVFWTSRTRVRSRLADHFFLPTKDGEGAIALIGDAAHSHSPAGGQGMNLSLIDAVLLGPVIKRHMETKDNNLLTTHEAARRLRAMKVVNLSENLTLLGRLTGWKMTFTKAAAWIVGHVPSWRKEATMRISGLSNR